MIFTFAILLITSLTIFVSPTTLNTKRASSVSAILNDVTELTEDVADLRTAVNGIPITGSSLVSVTTAGMNALNAIVTLSQLTSDVQSLGTTIDPTDAATILTEFTTLQEEVIELISTFVARMNTVEGALTGAGFFILTNFQNLINTMATAFQGVTPPEISPITILTLRTGVDDALTAALAAFPSCNSLISIGLNL